LREGTRFGASFNREQAGVGRSTIDLELLATWTTLDELVYKMDESRPEVISLDGGPGGLLPGMSGGGEVVVLSGDFSAKVGVVGNVKGSLIGKKGSFLGGESCPSLGGWLGRNFWMGSCEDLFSEGVGFVSSNDLGSERSVVDTLFVKLE
jgi:hypothetical protein